MFMYMTHWHILCLVQYRQCLMYHRCNVQTQNETYRHTHTHTPLIEGMHTSCPSNAMNEQREVDLALVE